jgi:hypothetical protein
MLGQSSIPSRYIPYGYLSSKRIYKSPAHHTIDFQFGQEVNILFVANGEMSEHSYTGFELMT